MPGITPSRYVRGIPNPHSAYASAEIPENVTIFKNLSRWQTTAPTTISVSQFYHCHRRANDTRCNSRARAPFHPTKERPRDVSRSTARVYAGANSCSRKSTQIHILTSVANVRSLDLLPLKIITPFLEQKPASSPTSRSFLLEPPLLL